MFFNNIEKLRGFACLLILVQHVAKICPIALFRDIIPIHLQNGSGAVHLFFAISGFVVTLSIKNFLPSDSLFINRMISGRKFLSEFYKKRFFRICPVLFFVIICIGIFCFCIEDNLTWFWPYLRAPFEILCGVYNYSVENFQRLEIIHEIGMGSFWTIAVEMQFYLFWPIVLLFFRDNSARAIFSLSLGMFFLFIVQQISGDLYGYKYYVTYNNLSEIFFGAFFAFVYKESADIKTNKKLLNIAVITALASIWIMPNISNRNIFTPHCVLTISSVSAVILAVFLNNNDDESYFGKFMVFLGKRSYSFYAIQLLLANIVVWFTNSIYFIDRSSENFEISEFALFMILLCIITEFVYNCIEKPLRKFGRS